MKQYKLKGRKGGGGVKIDHRSEFSNLSGWKEEAWKNKNSKFTAMIILHFHLFHLFSSFHS